MKQNHTLIKYKREILSRIALVMFGLITAMGLFRVYNRNYLQGMSDVVFGLLLLYTSIQTKKINEKAFFQLARMVFMLAFITLLILMIHTHETMTFFIWLSTAIYLIFYVFDNKESWIWFVGMTVSVVGIFIINENFFGIKGYELLVLVFNMFAVLLIITWYEKIKTELAKNLLEQQYILAAKVANKTRELRELNESLEQRIKEEVENNRVKDRQLIQQSRLAQMGEIISMIAHQWRQPLTAISASSAFLEVKARQQHIEPETVRKKAREISSISNHLSKTIDDFRDFFKPDNKKEMTSFDEIMESVQRITEASLEYRNIQLDMSLHCHEKFMTYANKVKQVILNLIQNAEDALIDRDVADPHISIRTYKKDRACILEVEDNAGGIPDALMEKIFDPYFSTKKKKEATGLGLYMSKVIIEEHCRGELKVENLEKGACFRIILYMDHGSEELLP
jgi:signal transduction histidine kinase